MNFRYFFILLFCFPLLLTAQIITWEPVYLTEDDSVTIYFDATQGNGGLAGYTGDVYAHTGVLSSIGSGWQHVKTGWGQNTPATKLERIATDLYQFVIWPSIRSYYGISSGEKVSHLAFVFRSANSPYLEGKTASLGDIFLPLRTGLKIITPAQNRTFPALNDKISVLAVAAESAQAIKLYLQNELLTETVNDTLRFDIVVNEYGKKRVKIVAELPDNVVLADSFYFVVNQPVTIEDRPSGLTEGVNYIDDQSVVLSLFAPEKDFIYVIGDFNNWEAEPAFFMKRSSDNATYWLEIDDLTSQQEYAYQFLIDGDLVVADPYTDKVLDPWNDPYIDAAIYPNLKPYPEGKTDGIVSVLRAGQAAFDWEVTNFERPAKTDLVIYEVLIRDFVNEHSYQGVIEKLDYLKFLGVNAVELMPVNEFEGNLSWGYNPSFYFAPDKYYGPKDDLKRLIDGSHARGMAVIIDMVLNHSYNQSPLAQMYWDGVNNRPAANNPWYNAQSNFQNPSAQWGNDFNHESPHTRKFVDRILNYWVTEFQVDGFRLDFTKGIGNNYKPQATDEWGSKYDADRIRLLKRMADQIWATDSTVYLILEHLAENTEEEELAEYGMLLWGNMNYNYNEATMGYHEGGKSDFSRGSYQQRGWQVPHLVTYMESHDEERLMYKNLQYGNSGGNYNVKNLETALDRIELASAFFFTIPGPKMIWQFGELGYDISIEYNGRLGEKPIRWDYYEQPHRRAVYKTIQKLTHFKKTYPAATTADYTLDVRSEVKRIHLSHPYANATIVGNFDVVERTVNPDFQFSGMWYDYLTADSLSVSDVNLSIPLAPGEFHVYTNVKHPTTVEPTVVQKAPGDFQLFQNFPNPFNAQTTISWSVSETGWVTLDIYNVTGQHIRRLFNKKVAASTFQVRWDGTDQTGKKVSSGVYFYRLQTGNFHRVMKMCLVK